MADTVGWRNFWWLNVAIHGFVFTFAFFAFPETKWHRAHPDEAHTHSVQPPSTPPSLGKDGIKGETIEQADSESQSPSRSNELSKQATAMRDPCLGKGTPKKSQFNLLQWNSNPFKSMLLDVWIPWKLFAFPIVEFASFVVSWSASSFLTINLTQSQVLGEPPYNFSSEQVGFTNFAILGGAMIGLLTGGPLSDWVSARLTRRNRGIREPEMRLLAMIPYVLIMILGNFVVAFGYQNHWDWRVSQGP